MQRAQLCPVCGGTGTIAEPLSSGTGDKTCHGCGGKGWVTVGLAEMPPAPQRMPYSPPTWGSAPWCHGGTLVIYPTNPPQYSVQYTTRM